MDKQTVIRELEAAFGELLGVVQGLDERAMGTVFYGTWDARDILAHMAGWQQAMTGALERMARGERPTPEGVDYSDENAWNAKFALALKQQSAPTVIARLQQGFANYLRAAKALPEDRFGEGKTVNRILEASGYGHCREHLPALKELRGKVAG